MFDLRRSEHAIRLRDGQTLTLHEIDPDIELDTKYRQIDQMILTSGANGGSRPQIGARGGKKITSAAGKKIENGAQQMQE